ncbi:MAG: hypothetical protein JXR73_21540 [Candidatus Omnitrophica bacterium]|nr:hypothetical protein [Candidatus Omnitrophota bacterium]
MTHDPSTGRRSDAMRAALLSAFVVPGAGQLYNGQWLKGFGILALTLICFLALLIPITLAIVGYYLSISAGSVENAGQALQPLVDNWIHLVVLVAACLGIYVYSIVDAYRSRMQKQNPAPGDAESNHASDRPAD